MNTMQCLMTTKPICRHKSRAGKSLEHCIVFIYKHCFPFSTANDIDFIAYIFIEIPYMNVINKVNTSVMSFLLFIAVPVYGIASFEPWGCFHLFIEYAVPMPFKECGINVILFWCDKHYVLDRFEVFSIVFFADILF